MNLKRRVAVPAAATAALSVVALAGTGEASTPSLANTQMISSSSGCHITASAANIRSSDSTNSRIAGVGYRGQTCTNEGLLAKNGHYFWYYIKMKRSHVIGWVRQDLIHL